MVTPTAVSSTMRSTRSSSARSWLATTTPPRQRPSSSATACRPSASRLLVGSSSSSTSGASISRRASATRVRSPPLSDASRRSLGRAGRPVSTSAASSRVSSDQSASAASSSEPAPLSRRRRRARSSATSSASATVNRSSAICASVPIEHERCTDPPAGSISPEITRSSVDLPQPLRPTTPIRSDPSASVSPSNKGRPSGVAREMESRVRNAGMESFRNGQGARSDLPGDVHCSLRERDRD